jgi:hypothetical protein
MPKAFRRRKNAWRQFETVMLGAGFSPVADPGPGAVVGFGANWTPRILLQNAEDTNGIVAAIGRALSPLA